MRALIVVGLLGLAALAASAPVHEEKSAVEIQTDDFDHDIETYGFGKKLRKGLKKVGKAIEKGAKKALEKGVSVTVPLSNLDIQTGIKDWNVHNQDVVLGRFSADTQTQNDDSETYGFGKKLRKGLKKVGKVIEKGAKKALEKGVSVTVPLSNLDIQTKVKDWNVHNQDDVLGRFSADTQTQTDDSETYGFGRKLRKGLKKVGKSIEKGAKKALEKGFSWETSTYALTDLELQEGLSEIEKVIHEIESFEDILSESTGEVYGLGKKLRKGLKKVGKAIEKGVKKVLEKGVSVTVPLYTLGDIQLELNDFEVLVQEVELYDAFIQGQLNDESSE